MIYLLTFLEGIVSFISPCLLPLLPIYLAYFAGDAAKSSATRRGMARSVSGAVAFIAGFALVFTVMGAFAGSLGRLLIGHRRLLEILCGCAIIVFGLYYLDLIKLPSLTRSRPISAGLGAGRFAWLLRSFVFGLSFSLSWTPCIGAFLGSALMLAANRTSALEGAALLLCYSLGLGLPFVLSALLIDRLKSSVTWLMRHHRLISRVSGALLIAIGLLLVSGWFGVWVTQLGTINW
ncbi:MAG: cytochrome c biogenesis protein CcdA [Actinomycetia bacterium]|nr:cytochrome c biogenesis protein CcdA [Actinomycetes bacterium]